MDKISQIIPQNPRTQQGDYSKSQPVRPGAPNFGRPTGRSTLSSIEDRISMNDAAKAFQEAAAAETATYNSRGAVNRSKFNDGVSARFFDVGPADVRASTVKNVETEQGPLSEAMAEAVAEG